MIQQQPSPPSAPAPDFVAPDGKAAWARLRALDVLREAASAGFAVARVEAWMVLQHPADGGAQTHCCFILHENGDLTLHAWEPEVPHAEGAESWSEYAARTAREAAAFVEDSTPDQLLAARLKDALRFHVEFEAEEEL